VTIQAERLQDVTLLTIDRPERRNAINTEACVDLKEAVDAGHTPDESWVVAGC